MILYDKGEKIQHIARRHNIAFILEIVFLFLSAIIPYIVYVHGLIDEVFNLFAPNNQNFFFLLLALYSLWLLFLWILFFIAWSDHYLDVWIITDGRVIDVEQKGIFRRRIQSVRLDKITDMQVGERSLLGGIFNYGNVIVTLEESLPKFVITEVPDPGKVKEIILAEQQKSLERLKEIVQFEAGK